MKPSPPDAILQVRDFGTGLTEDEFCDNYNTHFTSSDGVDFKYTRGNTMNIVKSLITRIENYRKTNKNPCKSYATEAAAERAAEKAAKEIAQYFHEDAELPQYVVFYNPQWGRWNVGFSITKLVNKYGGYLGIASEKGFYTY